MPKFIRFYSLACLFSWLIWLPLYLPKLSIPVNFHVPLNHALGGLGPMLAAIILFAKQNRQPGLRTFFQRMLTFRPLFYFFVALLSPFILLLLAAWIQLMLTGTFVSWPDLFQNREFPQVSFLLFFLYNFIFFGLGEEAGWVGYGVPTLQKKYGVLTTAVVFTLFWAIWHWPLFLYRLGYTSMDIAGITGWMFSLLTGRILLSWLQNSSRGSILIPALFHATIDIAFTSKAATESITMYMGMLITLWGIAILFVLKRKKYSGAGKQESDKEIFTPA